MVNLLVGLLVGLLIVLVIGIVLVAWSDAPVQLKSFGWALIVGGGLGSVIVVAILYFSSSHS